MELSLWIPAAIAVVLVGMSKGGVAGTTMIGVPLMSSSFPPLQAAAILLPLLIVMDVFAIWRYRQHCHLATLGFILPGALIGIVVGSFTFHYLPEDWVRFGIGAMAMFFGCYYLRGWGEGLHFGGSKPWGYFWGGLSGFTSFGLHAGGPPIKIYLLQQSFNRFLLAGTSAVYFGVVNWVKVIPYASLGYFEGETLSLALWLLPLAPVGVYLGAFIVKHVSDKLVYRLSYFSMIAIGAKLMYQVVFP